MDLIYLYGPPGSGKTTVGRLLAESLDLPFLDLDGEIETAAGTTIPQIMAEQGEAAFRDRESAALAQVVAGPDAVVALGGGALVREANRRMAEATGTIVFLDADLPTLLERIGTGENHRPLLEGARAEKLKALLERRQEHYGSFGLRIGIDLDTRAVQVAQAIECRLGRFHVRGMGAGYDVRIQPGGLDTLGNLLSARGLGGPVVVVSDTNVAPLYGEQVLGSLRAAGFKADLLAIPAGEQHKTFETVAGLWRGFLASGLDRRSTVVALGGGVTGDLAGFAAATFLRGCAWVGIPTSLLAMADSSLGGKTGFDLPQGKNLVGAFHSPRMVLADPDVLATLPEAELRSGLAEVVKAGVISDPDLFERCACGFEAVCLDLTEIVRRAMAVKVRVIVADPYEQGAREALNLGHTVGHAVEQASGYRLRHGEAVAIGMVVETRMAERLGLAEAGLAETLAIALEGLGLPVSIPGDLKQDEILAFLQVDKKKAAGAVRFGFPVRLGEVKTGVVVEDVTMIFG
ncbi:MAG: 3-dehydroquinate synthase [Anaerolineales bacterium]|nr:3-dehydroquinate synthase [Anaerolineales bacterium]